MNAQSESRFGISLLTIGHFFNDFYGNFLPVLLPLIMAKLGLTLTLSGLLIMIQSLTSNVMQPVFGYFIDKYNWNRLLLTAVPFGAVMMCVLGYVHTTFALFICVALAGLSVSLYHPLGLSVVNQISDPRRLGLALSIFVGGGNAGFAAAPLFLVYFLDVCGIEAMPYLILPTLLLSLGVYRDGLHRTGHEPARQQAAPLAEILHHKQLLKLNLAMGLRCWTHGAVTMFLPVLMVGSGYSGIISGLMLTVFLAGAALGGLYGGYLGDKFGCKKVIAVSLTLGIAPTVYFFTASDVSLPTALALFFCGAGLQTSGPGSIVWAQRMIPAYTGIASGMMLGLAFGIGGIGAAITGALGDIIGLRQSLFLTVIPLAAAAGIVYTVPEK